MTDDPTEPLVSHARLDPNGIPTMVSWIAFKCESEIPDVNNLDLIKAIKDGHEIALLRQVTKICPNCTDPKEIVITIRGGCLVDVENLPTDWTYKLIDWDNIKAEQESCDIDDCDEPIHKHGLCIYHFEMAKENDHE